MCRATLQQDDGHDCCPSCLGLEHLKHGLTDDACMNCSTMRTSGLVAVEALLTSDAPRQGKVTSKRKRVEAVSVSTSKRHREDSLANKVEVLTSESAQIKFLILNLQPREAPSPMLGNPSKELPIPEEDMLSMAASQNQFCEEGNEEFTRVSTLMMTLRTWHRVQWKE